MLRLYHHTHSVEVLSETRFNETFAPLSEVPCVSCKDGKTLLPDWARSPAALRESVHRPNKVMFWDVDTIYDVPTGSLTLCDDGVSEAYLKKIVRLHTTAPVCQDDPVGIFLPLCQHPWRAAGVGQGGAEGDV